MTFFSLILALLLEQLHPVRRDHIIQRSVSRQLMALRDWGQLSRVSPWLLWGLVVGLSGLFSLVVTKLLGEVNLFLELAATTGFLYLTLGFRQFSRWFTEIQEALDAGDVDFARDRLRNWVNEMEADGLVRSVAHDGDAAAIARESIRLALIGAQRHVFGVMFWFVILPGPAGAVMYWLSVQLLSVWRQQAHVVVEAPAADTVSELLDIDGSPVPVAEAQPLAAEAPSLADESARAGAQSTGPSGAGGALERFVLIGYRYLDWVPVRVTAFVFAIAGNFEDSLAMWRNRFQTSPETTDDEDRVLVAAGAGALGVRLTLPDAPTGFDSLDGHDLPPQYGPELDEVQPQDMAAGVGLVWRSVLIWLFMILLYTLGSWLT